MATFKTWTNPSNDQVRVYVSGLVDQKSSKVWVESSNADEFGFEYTINVRIPEGVYANKGNLIDDAEKEVFKAAQSRIKKFAEVMALAE